MRLRAMLAQAKGDEAVYRDFADRYRTMANELGFEGTYRRCRVRCHDGVKNPAECGVLAG
jgi:hypothetical protein